MATKNKNNKKQTSKVYPYLSQYQYLMRNGGQLPWYQDEGPVEKKNKYTLTSGGRTYEFDTYEEYKAKWEELMPNMNVPPDPYADKNTDKGEPADPDEVRGAKTKCTCPEGYEKAGTEYFASGEDCRFDVNCGEKLDPNAPDTSEGSPEGEPVDDESTGKTTDDQELEGSPEGEGSLKCPETLYIECAQKGLAVNESTCECQEEQSEKEVSDDVKKKAIQDYEEGKISRKEMEGILGQTSNLGKGITKGGPEFELSPTSKWGLLADALDSTGRAIKGFGRQSINPKTGKPYTKGDFKQITVDAGKLSNVNEADLYWDNENLRRFIEDGDKDLSVSDVIGTQNMHLSRRYDDYQDNLNNQIKQLQDKGLISDDKIRSNRSIDRKTGQISYDDIEYQEDVEVENPDFDPNQPEGPDNPKMITETVTKTRAFDPEKDRTDLDIATDKTRDYSVRNIVVDDQGQVTNLVRTGPEANPNIVKDGKLTPYQMETYDPDRSYQDNIEIKRTTSEQEKKKKREGIDDENVDDNPSGLIEESRIDNGDGTVTIKYTNGSTKVIKTPESSQERKNRLRKERENNEEANMGLEMFVYGGQRKLDKYQKKGEKVHDFLEYHPNFPRTGYVPYTGNFTANELQNAITRDSTYLENELRDSWLLRNFMGQDQTSQSNMGPAGKLQLNREWLHKLLMQDDQERANKLNYYRDGGGLPFYEEGDEKDKKNKNKSDGPADPPKDNNATPKDVPVDDTNEEVNEDAANPDANTTPDPTGSPEGDGSPAGEENPEEETTAMTDEEMTEMDETSFADSDAVSGGYGNIYNRAKAATKTGIVDRAINTYGDVAGAVTKWADFGNAVLEGWQNEAAETKAKFSNTTGEDQFTTQESSQGIYDPNSGDSFTNQKVDEIYAGNTMKGPMIMQMGGQDMAQPTVDNVNYAALAEFTGSNPYNVEVSFSPEVIAYQKQIMAKMAYGGHLPMAQDGWWDKAKNYASEKYDQAKKVYDETDFKTPINKALDYTQTAMSGAGMIPVVGNAVDLVNTGISGARAGYAYATGDQEGVKDHLENAALNAASAVPGAGQAAGAMALAKDTAKYTGVMEGSASTNLANAITGDGDKSSTPATTPPTNQMASNTAPPKEDKPAPVKDDKPVIAKKKEEPKVEKVAKYGEELDIDYETLQELIKAGADIEII